jgi:hypothetical protein
MNVQPSDQHHVVKMARWLEDRAAYFEELAALCKADVAMEDWPASKGTFVYGKPFFIHGDRSGSSVDDPNQKMCPARPTVAMVQAAVKLQSKGPALWADLWHAMWEAWTGEP